ncbi:hypothetical protein FDP41_002426 [Naegleria fowleri]|uniref:Uncharacterized protein n=1 Tax=Naegleria fowleri TaxID=5763 RepID=A0A6A5BTR6_NAEFO|nr:uncharacterized protein FDP41_002426 [Naegleria fowleri]KAF0978606.1 hypothetical protein FDP41_002426 [Naegleria fowleri]CAG4710439.1 unnamed protein product [Naegleria fowleri]
MGSTVSVDSSVFANIEAMLRDLRAHLGRESEETPNSYFQHNIKGWIYEERISDEQSSLRVSALDFTKDFTSFSANHSYVLIHTFRNQSRNDNVQKSENRRIKLSSHSLLQLVASASNISLEGLEAKLSTGDLQEYFFSKSSNFGFRKSIPRDEETYGFSVYVWHGKAVKSYVKFKAISDGYDLERELLRHERRIERIFHSGNPVSICDFYHNDLPTKQSGLKLSNASVSSLAICLTLFQHCHLFRNLFHSELFSIQDDTKLKQEYTFSSLLQLPPSDTNLKGKPSDDMDAEYVCSPANSPRGEDS